jgi:thiol-disulfide isomerase/thioredoxin
MPMRQPDGRAHIKGKISGYSPDSGYTFIPLSSTDVLSNKSITDMLEITPDGGFEGDVSVPSPQRYLVHFGNELKNIFLLPGDTLDLTKSVITPSSTDSEFVTILADSLRRRYDLDSLKKYVIWNPDTSRAPIYASNKILCEKMDEVMTDLPNIIGSLHGSILAKDMVASYVAGEFVDRMEDNEWNFNEVNGPEFKFDSNGKYSGRPVIRLDQHELLLPKLKYKGLIYDNPLIVSLAPVLISSWMRNKLFGTSVYMIDPHSITFEMMVRGQDINETGLEAVKQFDNDNLKDNGIGNCFAAQIVRGLALNSLLQSHSSKNKEGLEYNRKMLADLSTIITYPSLTEVLLESYGNLANEVARAEWGESQMKKGVDIDMSKFGDVLETIIAPYKGNVLFLDFWDMGCGPCRAGMMNQRPILEKFADKPFKALYISDDEDVAKAENWLEKENIKGEHIYISKNDYAKMQVLFQFDAIPFGVLIDKDGSVLALHYYLDSDVERLEQLIGN